MENLLPTEVVLDILSRLPAPTVLRCKQVCKAWRSLLSNNINNNKFAHSHLHHQLQQLDDDATKFHNHLDVVDDAANLSFISLVLIDCKSNSTKDDEEDLGFLLHHGVYDEKNNNQEEKSYSYKILTIINYPAIRDDADCWVGSCNGLICMSLNHHDIFDPVYICNPITRECLNIPFFTDFRGPKCSRKISFYNLREFGYMMSGFGYNLNKNEYKVVRVYYGYDDNDHAVDGLAQVYTLGNGTGWRNTGETTYKIVNSNAVFANGALHWLERSGKIIAFDLADEKFRLLPSPPFLIDYESTKICDLGMLGGCLCIFYRSPVNESMDIWSFKKKMKNSDYDNDGKEEYKSWYWDKEFSIDIPGEGEYLYHYKPFALVENGNVLLWLRESILARYDRKTATLEKLVDYNEQGVQYGAHIHMNSFVSLKSLGEDSKINKSVEEGEYSECRRIGQIFF